jgi:hypothetical protein
VGGAQAQLPPPDVQTSTPGQVPLQAGKDASQGSGAQAHAPPLEPQACPIGQAPPHAGKV